jgi:hypothetical protein
MFLIAYTPYIVHEKRDDPQLSLAHLLLQIAIYLGIAALMDHGRYAIAPTTAKLPGPAGQMGSGAATL